ncbi:MAG TPA: isoleucine--tRNA ligase, partial [Candidatus Bathyarchaeota archaeon]|nr:isoleucine--tRNA ligase [Candidatus Bathyarchaeota archaeon]
TCLKTLLLLLAPFTPFITEALYQRLVRRAEPDAPESIHLNDWPEPREELIDEGLMADMEMAMRVSSLGRAARSSCGIKLRQPLQEAVVVADPETLKHLRPLMDLIRDELNVKRVRLTEDRRTLIRLRAKPIPRLLGRKYGALYPKVAEAVEALSEEEVERLRRGEAITLEVEGETVELRPEEIEIREEPREGYVLADEMGIIVGVYTELTEELRYEGLARDIVRRIQALRKEADFEIDDRIETYYLGDPELEKAFEVEAEYIAAETLSIALHRAEPPEGAYVKEYEIDGRRLKLGLVRIGK